MKRPNRPNVLTRAARPLFVFLATCTASVVHADFTAGSVVVERIGDGVTAIGGNTTSVALLEFAPTGGSALQALDLSAGSPPFTTIGSTTSEGFFNSSANGSGFVVPGYSLVSGVASATATTSTSARKIISVSPTGSISGSTLISGTYTGNFRSIASTGAGSYWTSSSTLGVGFTDGAASPTQVSTSVTNTRTLEIFGSVPQLYVTAASGAFIGLNVVGTGTPTSSGNTITPLISIASGSPYGFFMYDANADGVLDRAWIADDRTGAGGGLLRYNFDGTNWVSDYALRLDTTLGTLTNTGTLQGLRGLAASVSGDTVSIFASDSSGTRLVNITDSVSIGADPSTFNLVATSGTNFVFRGVEVVAVPEPGTLVSLVGGFALLGLRRRRNK